MAGRRFQTCLPLTTRNTRTTATAAGPVGPENFTELCHKQSIRHTKSCEFVLGFVFAVLFVCLFCFVCGSVLYCFVCLFAVVVVTWIAVYASSNTNQTLCVASPWISGS